MLITFLLYPEHIYYVKLNKESHIWSLIALFFPVSHQVLKVRSVPFAASNESFLSVRLREKHTKHQLNVVTELTAFGGCHQFVKLHAAYSYQILVVSCLEEDFILFAKAGLRIPNCL